MEFAPNCVAEEEEEEEEEESNRNKKNVPITTATDAIDGLNRKRI